MKRYVPALLLLIVMTTACKNTWDQEDKDLFYQACMEDANTWAGSQEKAKTYCNCVLDKVMQKFPNEGDALDHMDSVINDPDIRSCKKEIMNQP